MLAFNLTDDVLSELRVLNQRLAQKHAQISRYSTAELEMIHTHARISMIGASTRIENAQLTDNEVEWLDTLLTSDDKPDSFLQFKTLIKNKLDKDRERSIEEVAGARAMLQIIYAQAKNWRPLTASALRGLHHELLRFYSKAGPNVGCYKRQPNSVVMHNHATGESKVVFKTADAGAITQAAMADLLAWYNEALVKEPWAVAVSCEFVFRFLAIHPFQDGNGRVGRGLFLLSLLQSPDTPIATLAPYLAIDRQIEKHRAEYYAVLNRCSGGQFKLDPQQYHIEHFMQFMLKVLNEALEDIDFYHNQYVAKQKLSQSASTVLTCFKEHPEIRLTTKLICTQTHLPRRTVINALNALLAGQFIQRYGQGAGVRYQLLF